MVTLQSDSQTPEIPPQQCWDALQRVVNSQELKRALRLRELLLFLGRRSLKDHVGTIREQEIGAAVFGRPEDYDTNIDNIVRVNVSELRKRLLHYYQTEGATEPILIEIPRGAYLPVFVHRPPANETPEPSPALELAPAVLPVLPPGQSLTARAARPRQLLLWILGAALVCALGSCVFLWMQQRDLRNQLQPWQSDPVRAAFWSHFLANGQQVDIVTADTSYALAEDILRRPISLDDYLDYSYKNYANLAGVTPETRDALNLVLDRNTGSVGDFEAAERFMELDAHSTTMHLASARSYTPASVKRNNLILIGSRESNPWVELYKDHLNFFVEYDPSQHRSYVVNRQPEAGEQRSYEIVQDRDREYSVVAFLPNLSEHRYVLIVAGTDSQGTRAAGEFITSSEGIAAIRQHLPADKYPYFEVLLASSRLQSTTLGTSILAFRGHSQ